MRYLKEADPEVCKAIRLETARQNNNLELIASENFVSMAVLEAMGSQLTTNMRKVTRVDVLRRLASLWT